MSKTLSVFLVDDEQRALEGISLLIDTYAEDVEIIGTAQCVEAAYQSILSLQPQLVFLDVNLGPETGFDLLEKFEQVDFQVVFVTAHDEYAIRAIRFAALDYLLKPPNVEELRTTIKKAREKLRTPNPNDEMENFLRNGTGIPKFMQKVALPVLDGHDLIEVGQIMYLLADGNYSKVKLKDGQTLLSSKTLRFFEEILDGYGFYRVHSSALISHQHLKKYRKWNGGTFIMDDGEEIGISRRKKEGLLKVLNLK